MSRYLRWGLVGVVVAGLAFDAYTHFDLASMYAPVKNSPGSVLNQGLLFRVEAVLAVLAALALLIRPNLASAAAAFVVAAGGASLLTLYRYVEVGKIGPLPDMYEPAWFPEKTNSLIAMIVAAVSAAGVAVLTLRLRRGRSKRRSATL